MNWLRDHMKEIIWIIVVAFILTIFAGWGMGGLDRRSPERELAVVDGEIISMARYHEIVNQVREEFRDQRDDPLDEEANQKVQEEAFRRAVNEILLQRFAEQEGARATADEIRQFVAAQFRDEAGRIDHQEFRRFLQHISPAQRQEIEAEERKRIETMRVYNWLENQLSIPTQEIEQSLASGLRELDLYGLFVDPGSFLEAEAIQTYYENNEEQFMAPPQAHLRQIMLKGDDVEDPDTPESERLDEIGELRERIQRQFRAGIEFPELARRHSQDTETVNAGGDLGWVTPEDLPEQLSRAAFDLEPGEMSEMIVSGDDYYFLYLENPIEQEVKPLPEVRDEIVGELLTPEHWEHTRSEAQELYDQITAAEEPLVELKNLAHRSDGFTSGTEGQYDWVPVRFLPEYLDEQLRQNWSGELISAPGDNRILPPVTNTMLDLLVEAKTVAEPVETDYGMLILGCREHRPGRPEELLAEEEETFKHYIRTEKINHYVDGWLKWRRLEAEVELEVPEERIGGRSADEVLAETLDLELETI